ncbi:Teneurin-3, partial [Caligus rogercresseyi]
MYDHRPSSGLEMGFASIPEFYREDHVKYHGKSNRGVDTLNFFAKANKDGLCENQQFKYPSNCIDENDCLYTAKWSRRDDYVDFIVTNKVDEDVWTAIGISNDRFMPSSDIIAGYVDGNGNAVVNDMWVTTYTSPRPDEEKNLKDMTYKRENGVATLKFSKPISSPDTE